MLLILGRRQGIKRIQSTPSDPKLAHWQCPDGQSSSMQKHEKKYQCNAVILLGHEERMDISQPGSRTA